MDKDLIASAMGKLELLNLVLHEANFIRSKNQDPLSYPTDTRQDSKLSVRTEELTYQSAASETGEFNVFRVYVEVGVRAVKEESDQSADSPQKTLVVYYGVEATFRVDYLLKSEKLTAPEAAEFANFNAVHNVWPFWREQVFHSLRAADLPLLNVPLMRGMKIKSNREMLKNQGGGELIVKGRDGVIRSKDTIAPGHDPNPPKDREH